MKSNVSKVSVLAIRIGIGIGNTLLLRPGRGVLWSVCLSVRLSVWPWAYLWNRWTDHHGIFCADRLWPWLGPLLAALRYVMYFRFYGWRHVWPQWVMRGKLNL